MSEEERVIERVRELVVTSLQLPVEAAQIDVDEPLFGGDATVDSMGSLEIVAAIEREYGFQVPDDDLRVELFDSVRTLSAYVLSRREPVAETGS
ncbi:MAG TPA: phosphopantetheine-binding protein [Candidatus Latescibacteria bacterium]|jgi:acyl carrier protein|nr:acyl carrier protein [Gemmatimonadaceae bacterium]MDP6018613.1 phosphopantetheine-binding protein [Candidatus Latescibacterota bacterium]HJP32835.1 phosphopantetheine-binding protein [Candidatus Latescibacterota bacterium]|tara:strand:+ start:59 stop:340 length:282 start_codon:yes stop_codon:yes gene_type:complete